MSTKFKNKELTSNDEKPMLNDVRNILVTFSGGRTSAFMAKYIKERYCNDNILFVFANTGKEAEATLEFANKCDKEFELNLVWLEAEINPEKGIGTAYKIVGFETANRNGLPFRNAIKNMDFLQKFIGIAHEN